MAHSLPSSSSTSTLQRSPHRALTGFATCVTFSGVLLAASFAGAMGSPAPSAIPIPRVQPDPNLLGTIAIEQSARIPTSPVRQPDTHLRSGFAKLVAKVRPAVVNITVSKDVNTSSMETPLSNVPKWFGHGPRDRNFFGRHPFPAPKRTPRGMGSGVIVSPDGYVVTNHHVIEGAKTVTVTLLDKRTLIGTIVGSDPQTDLAVIRIEGQDLPFISWGDSSTLEVGDYVLAVGNPFGLLSTVTQGIVSAKGRGGMGITQYEDFIQTDAAINPGNSGGALVNMRGELVGINTAILSRTGGYQGVGFAVPARIGQHVYTSLIETGTVIRGFLGVGIQAVTPDLAHSFRLDRSVGAIVTNVREDSPAAHAGLRQGDTVIRYQGQPMTTPRDLQHAVTTTPVGTDVTITVVRDGKERTLHTTIMAHPTSQRVTATSSPDATSHLAGLAVDDLTPRLAQRLGVDDRVTGVVVTDILVGSRAAEAGLAQGDIIREINRQPVPSLNTFRQMVKALPDDQPVLLFIHRQGTSLFLTVKV